MSIACRTNRFAFVLCILLGAALARAAGESPTTAPSSSAASDAFNLVGSLVGGEWRIEAKWSSGAPLKARASYEWGVGKKFVEAKTFPQDEKGVEYQRYLTIFGNKDGKLISWGFMFDGHTDTSEWTLDGKKLSSAKSMPAKNGGESKAILHQSIELTDANQMRWVVVIENDGKKEQIMDGTWVRQSVGAAK
jgi:hypothetical protein